MSKITEKSTKATIFSAYQKLKQEYEKTKKKFNLEEPPSYYQDQKKEVIESAENISKEYVFRFFDGMKDELEELHGKYEKIKEAISLKEKELKEVYDIERKCETLKTLIETASRVEEEEREKTYARKQERLREEEEWEYEWAKIKRTTRDNFNNEMEERRAKVELREEAMANKEDEFAKLVEFKERSEEMIRQAVDDELELQEKELKKNFKYEMEMKELENKQEKSLLEQKVQTLSQALKDKAEAIKVLEDRTRDMQERIQELSTKALETSQQRVIFADSNSKNQK